MDKNNKKVGKKPAQHKKYPAQYKEYGGSGKGVEDSETEYNPVPDIEAGKGEGSGKVMGYAQTWGAARKSGAARGAAAVAKVLGAALPDPDESKKAKPSSPIPDYSASLNTKVPKAPTLTGNSYAGHSSVSDIVKSQSSNRDFSSTSAMNLKDNQISRNSQFHYDTGNTGKLTPEISASYDKFLGEKGKYISSRDMKKTNQNVNLNNPIYKSNQKAQEAYKEGRIYNQNYGF